VNRRVLRWALPLVGLACRAAPAPSPLRLGTTYTVAQSGALAVLESLWTAPPLATVIGPSGQILRSAANGDLDVVITHAPVLEARLLVAPGHALLACPLVASRFAVVGPPADPARVAGAASAVEAFRRIARSGAPFVSRGDSSGTNVKELALWRAAGVAPRGPWYLESGADQAATLRLADEKGAYALADLPTLAKLAGIGLRVLFAADTTLTNPYTLYVIRTPDARPAARQFAAWAVATARPAIAAIRLPDGSAAFASRGGACAPPTRAPAAPSPAARGRPSPRRPAARSAPPPPAAELMGRWAYVAPRAPAPPGRPTLGGGLRVTLTLDSAAGRTAYGQVTHWFAGDVGIPATAFGRVAARLEDSAQVTIIIPPARSPAAAPAPIVVRTRRRGRDTLAVAPAQPGDNAGPFGTGLRGMLVRTGATERR
jgi:tungstate transport system substrate-binding protein